MQAKRDDDALIPIGGGYAAPVLQLLAVLIALVAPGLPNAQQAASAMQLGAEGLKMLETVAARREQQRRRRLELVVEDLERRLRGLEVASSDQKVDLFLEVMRKAVEDDETGKEVFYSALLEWVARHSPPVSQVRVLSEAVRDLSFVELDFFIRDMNDLDGRSALLGEIDESTALARLQSKGLAHRATVRVGGSPTSIGGILKKHCEMSAVLRACERRKSLQQ